MDEINSMLYESKINPLWKMIQEGKPRSGKSIGIIKDTVEFERTVNMLKERGYKVKTINLTKSKCGWFNPITGESSYIKELKEKAKKAIKSKKYRKAYRLLSRAKKLQKRFKKSTLCIM